MANLTPSLWALFPSKLGLRAPVPDAVNLPGDGGAPDGGTLRGDRAGGRRHVQHVGRGAGRLLVAEVLPGPYAAGPEPLAADGPGPGRGCRPAPLRGHPPRH